MAIKQFFALASLQTLASAVTLADEITSVSQILEKKALGQTALVGTISLNVNTPYLFYTGSVNFGTPSQVNDGIIFDTTQAGIQISGTPCGICNNKNC